MMQFCWFGTVKRERFIFFFLKTKDELLKFKNVIICTKYKKDSVPLADFIWTVNTFNILIKIIWQFSVRVVTGGKRMKIIRFI